MKSLFEALEKRCLKVDQNSVLFNYLSPQIPLLLKLD